MNKGCMKSLLSGVLLLLLAISTRGYALPFNIFPLPGTSLPTQVVLGSSATAFYTVQNNTGTNRINNAVTYLPLNVSQVTTDAAIPNLCGPIFNLAARGTVGDSCTLELRISGAVSAIDPDPHHHLFVCFPGNKTCAGTQFPLNVTVTTTPTPTPTPVAVPKFGYFTNFQGGGTPNNTISICAMNANGSVGTCTLQTDAAAFNDADALVINSAGTRAYILNQDSNTLVTCAVNQVNGTLNTCAITPTAGNITAGGLTLRGNFLYVTSFDVEQVTRCLINADGSIGTCAVTGGTLNFDGINGQIGLNPSGTVAYVANYNSSGITICNVNTTTGLFSSCTPGQGNLINRPLGATVNPAGTYLYVPNSAQAGSLYPNQITICPITPTGLGTCQLASGNGTFDLGQEVSNLQVAQNNIAYVPNQAGTTVSLCPVLSTGLFGTCTTSTGNGTFTLPTSAWITFIQG